MGLFDKKYCDICGDKIGLLGNRKLSDGNMCKECAKKLSPWFSERKKSTKSDIEAQLTYREQNKAAAAAFHASKVMGVDYKVYIDEAAGKFMISDAKDPVEANADVIDLNCVTGARVDVTDSRQEVFKTNSDGKKVSYNPPRYKYSYNFYVVVTVNHPYFDEMRFQPSNRTIVIQPNQANLNRKNQGFLESVVSSALNQNAGPTMDPKYKRAEEMCDQIVSGLMNRRGNNGGMPRNAGGVQDGMGNSGFGGVAAASSAPQDGTWVCSCGNENTGKFCTECGSKRP